MDAEDLIIVSMLGAGLFIMGFLIGMRKGEAFIQDRAIEAKVAQWTIDPKTGEKEFVFKECGE